MANAAREVSRKGPLPVYAVFGGDSFLCLRALHALLNELLGPARDQMAVAEFDGVDARLADVLDECRSASLLAPLRVVCVREADTFVKEHREALEKYVDKPSTTGVLVLVCRTWQRSTRLYKAVEQVGRNIACEPPKPMQLPGWIVDHARSAYGCTIQPDAARRLADLIGDQLGLIDEELSKLATFVWPKTAIGSSAVEELVGASRSEKVFGITDCIAERNAPGALALWEQVLSTNRSAPFMALGGLGYGFRNIAEAKRLVARGMSVWDASKRCHLYGEPDRIKKRLDRFSLRHWEQFLAKLLRIDVGAKSGLGSFEAGVEKFIVELCHA